MGCPSTPKQEQPNLHDDYSYIGITRTVKNFVYKINHIHIFENGNWDLLLLSQQNSPWMRLPGAWGGQAIIGGFEPN